MNFRAAWYDNEGETFKMGALVMVSCLDRKAFMAFSFWNTTIDMYLDWHVRIKPWHVIKLNNWKYLFYYIKFNNALPILIPLWLHSIFSVSPHHFTLPSSYGDKKKYFFMSQHYFPLCFPYFSFSFLQSLWIVCIFKLSSLCFSVFLILVPSTYNYC